MSLMNFDNLLKSSFDKGAIKAEYLEQILRNIVTKLNLNDEIVKIDVQSNIDSVSNLIPSHSFIKEFDENLIMDVLKRVDELENNVQKLTSIIQTIVKHENVNDIDSMKRSTHELLISEEIFEKDSKSDLISIEDIGNTKNDESAIHSEHEKNVSLKEKRDGSIASNKSQHKINLKENETHEDEEKVDSSGNSKKSLLTIFENTSVSPDSSLKICCNSDLLKSISYQTLGIKKTTHLRQIPCMQTLNRLMPIKSSRMASDDVKNCITQLENHIIQQSDAVNSIINQNQFFLQQQICDMKIELGEIHEKIKDLFFACEQNDEQIYETNSSMNDFNSKIFCLKSDVKTLMNDLKGFKEKFTIMDEKCDALSNCKANTTYVDEMLAMHLEILYSELKKFTRLEDFHDKCDSFDLRMSVYYERLEKLEKDIKKALICIKVKMDEKMEKHELKNFKNTVEILFDEFVRELKFLLFKMSENSLASGASMNLLFSCISSESMVKTFGKLDTSANRFKHFIDRIQVAKKDSSRIKMLCGIKKQQSVKPVKKLNELKCHSKESLLTFPNTQKCFIITKDNTIIKADPLKCLKNSDKFTINKKSQ